MKLPRVLLQKVLFLFWAAVFCAKGAQPFAGFTYIKKPFQPSSTRRFSTTVSDTLNNQPLITTPPSSLRPDVEYSEEGSGLNWPARERITIRNGNPVDYFGKEGGLLYGNSRRTYYDSLGSVALTTNGRPLEAKVQIWEGPDYAPAQMELFSENGETMPWKAGFAGTATALDVRNIGPMEFPLQVWLDPPEVLSIPQSFIVLNPTSSKEPDSDGNVLVQGGGAIEIFRVNHTVRTLRVTVESDGLPMEASVQLLSGPSNIKQSGVIYADDGRRRPWTAVMETPFPGSSLVIENSGPMEYPIKVRVEAILD